LKKKSYQFFFPIKKISGLREPPWVASSWMDVKIRKKTVVPGFDPRLAEVKLTLCLLIFSVIYCGLCKVLQVFFVGIEKFSLDEE
jgi:hypothetical protein